MQKGALTLCHRGHLFLVRYCRCKEENLLNLIFLTQQGGILKPFAWVMGKILNAIYELVSLVGIHNIAICIIIFTFVTKMLMLPLTIKQQKFSKLSSKMSPELNRIQEKYKGKKDEASVRRQQMEMQEVYDKYGTNPIGGCLPLLITFPILFALIRVIYAVPAYINDVRDLYLGIANVVQGVEGYSTLINNFISENQIVLQIKFSEDPISAIHLVDAFSVFNMGDWSNFFHLEQFGAIQSAVTTIDGLTVREVVSEIEHINSFVLGMNILDRPGWQFPGILIPIIATILYYLQSKLAMSSNNAGDVDNPGMQSMKMMNTIMPIISGIFCVFIPIGVGIYWIAGSAFQILQQIFINRYMDKVDVDELIEKSVEKSNKRKAKMGIETGSKMANVAKTSTKGIDARAAYEESLKRPSAKDGKKGGDGYKKREVSYSANSIAANANILKDRERDKGEK